jgi:signal transduction histidine kinase
MIHSLETTVSPKAALKRQASAHTLMIKADAGQIRQSIMNLATNASEALGDQEGVITLATGTMEANHVYLSDCYFGEELPEGPYVYLEVSDTGRGMDEETIAKIFVPFFAAKSSGRGLGLATVVGTVRAHHGAIRVKSTSEGGTTFRVLFPQLTGETAVED